MHTIQTTPFRKLDKLKGIPQPFPYQGSKRLLASAIVPLIPNNTKRIIEPFCGSAAISIAALYLNKVERAIISDSNKPLIDLWKNIINNPDSLAKQYESLWFNQLDDSKAYFKKVRSEFNEEFKPAQLLYLLNRIVKGSIRYGKDGKFNQSSDNRRLGAKPNVVRSRIIRVHEIMDEATAIACDYKQAVFNANVDDFIYMDPPYQGTSNNADHRYSANLKREDYEPVLREMNRRGLSYIVSYDVVDDKLSYGKALSDDLNLIHLHLVSGVSAQATLLGRNKRTIESLYLSPALVNRLGGVSNITRLLNDEEITLF